MSNKPLERPNRAAPAFIIAVILLDVASLGLSLPVLPKLLASVSGETRAVTYAWFLASWQLAQLVAAPILGALSDRVGRRPVILLSTLGMGLNYLFTYRATDLWLLFAARVLAGVTASSFSVANAYIADSTPPERRPEAFATLGSAFSIGFVAGPALGGLLGGYDIRLPFAVAGLLSLMTLLYGFFVLPESLRLEDRKAFSLSRANPLRSMAVLVSSAHTIRLSTLFVLHAAAQQVYQSVFVYMAAARYHWDARATGLSLTFAGLTATLAQVLLIRPFANRLGARRLILLGLLSQTAGLVGLAMAPTGWFALAAIAASAPAGAARAGIQTRFAALTEKGDQGRLQGALSSLTCVVGAVAPHGFGWLYDRGRVTSPFWAAALLAVLGVVVSWADSSKSSASEP